MECKPLVPVKNVPQSMVEKKLICISPINWDEVWEGPQEITSRFAAAGWQVVFVENIGGRTPRWSWHDASRIGGRLKRLLLKSQVAVPPPAGVTIHTPFTLPPYSLSCLHRLNRAVFVRGLRSRLDGLGWDRPVVWTYNPSRVVLEACSALNPSLLIYCCINDYTLFSHHHAAVAKNEGAMVRAADLVFVVSQQLLDEKRQISDHVYSLPQGANLRDYMSPAASTSAPELARLQSPIVGYIGTIHEWVDQDLLRFLARSRPEWIFVMIGPERVSTAELRKLPNIKFLGFKAHHLLPAYVSNFDVGIIPYVTEGFGQVTRPNKVLEYLVMGKPVVTTALPELRELGSNILSAGSAAEFLQALEIALRSDSPTKRMQRREVAIANSLGEKFAEVEELVLAKLERSPVPLEA